MPLPVVAKTITLPQAVALYAGAVVGAGVLILPGVAADKAGPASLVAWVFDGALGIPIALTFAALAARFPDAGGVSVYAARAFGAAAGAVVGWFYFVAAAVAQALVVLTGAHYAADELGSSREAMFALAGAMLVVALAVNMLGMRPTARLQLALAAAVAGVLLAATVAAAPEIRLARLQPFVPHGWRAVGEAAVLLFFAFFGWEAITHLSAEFRDPARDVRTATLVSVALVTIIYLGVSLAVVGTATYGQPELDRVAVAHVLGRSLGVDAEAFTAATAVLITLATANTFVAATSRLGYALARDRAMPSALTHLGRRGVPSRSVLLVGAIAGGGLAIGYWRGWGAEAFLVVPNSLVIVVYIVGSAAGVRLLAGRARVLPATSTVLCSTLLPFAGISLALPVGVAAAALACRSLIGRVGS